MNNTFSDFFTIEPYDLTLLFIAVIVLSATVLVPLLTTKRYLTPPVVFLTAGLIIFLLPIEWPLPSLINEPWLAERLTEIVVIISLTSVGLKINEPFSWKTWRISFRLLTITMPLTIAASAILGWWFLGFAPATALLFGAVIAPTDPVLASDVQTTKPNADDISPTRVALTTEAGLNDGLAFPFTNLALAVAFFDLDPEQWLVKWLLIDVGYKILAGVIIGAVAGWFIAFLLFTVFKKEQKNLNMMGMVVLALTFFPYSLTELASGYGFIAVFVSACVFRQQEAQHHYQDTLHDFAVECEQVLIAVVMFVIGAYIADGIFASLTFPLVATALLVIFVIRTFTGFVALPGTGLSQIRRWTVAFYGIRGVGSLYYLAYALEQADFQQVDLLWALTLFIIMVSVFVHGISARYVMEKTEPLPAT